VNKKGHSDLLEDETKGHFLLYILLNFELDFLSGLFL
jgi:hypothetical protein